MVNAQWLPRSKKTGAARGRKCNAAAMLRGILVILWGFSALCIDKEAADAQKIYLIGSLTTSEQFVPSLDGFKARMAELGYREGQNVRYSFYNSKGDQQLLKAQTEKLVQEKPDLIVTTSTTATLMAAKTTERLGIPVLFLSAGNPSLLVKSFKSSGTNLAGISSGSLDLVGKRFELLRELSPKIKRIAMPIDPKSLLYQSNIAEAEQSAAKMGMTVKVIPVESAEELEKASAAIDRREVDAIFMPSDSLISEGESVAHEVGVAVENARRFAEVNEKTMHWQKLIMNCSRPPGQSRNSSPRCPTNSGRLSTSSSETRI